MSDGPDRLVEDHPRTGIAHHHGDPLAHIGSIAVDWAELAEGALLHEGAGIVAIPCIKRQFAAVWA